VPNPTPLTITYSTPPFKHQSTKGNPDSRGRALLIGGGIANFTDVAATFKGITQALREQAPAVVAAKLRLFVRRGGPNYQQGLAAMEAVGAELGIPVEVRVLLSRGACCDVSGPGQAFVRCALRPFVRALCSYPTTTKTNT
jgi:hypothetical protein